MANQMFNGEEAKKLFHNALSEKSEAMQKVIETAIRLATQTKPKPTGESIADEMENVLHEYARTVALCTKLEIMKEQING